jgi:GDP-4-dehydro-6-deoxy-D-mannose reductase
MSETILVTGGSGFVGQHLIEHLLEIDTAPAQIHATVYGSSTDALDTSIPTENIHQLDLTDAAATRELLRSIQPSQIYHLASIATVGNSFEQAQRILHNNTDLQLSLLEAITMLPEKPRLLAISSAAVYAPSDTPLDESAPLGPSNPYAVSKTTQDHLAQSYQKAHDLDIIIARPFNHTGPGQGPHFAIPAFAQQIARIEAGQQETLRVGNLEAVRDISDVRDVVRAYSLLMREAAADDIYNVGAGHEYTMQQYLDMLLEHADSDIPIEQDPARMRPSDTPYSSADSATLRRLGWEPRIPIQQTLLDTLEYWRADAITTQ